MKIGIDAKWFYSSPVSGQVILRNVLPELIKTNPEHEWHIFLDKKSRHLDFPLKNSKVHLHYTWAAINMFSNFFVLPGLAKKIEELGTPKITMERQNSSLRAALNAWRFKK